MPDTNDLWPENIADSNLIHPGVHLETTGRAAGREDSPSGEGRSRHSDHRQPVRPLFLYCRSHAQLQIRIVHSIPRRQLLHFGSLLSKLTEGRLGAAENAGHNHPLRPSRKAGWPLENRFP